MRESYWGAWALVLFSAALCLAWIAFGKAHVRKRYFGVAPITEAARTESQFVAVLLPRITARRQKYAMSSSELAALLGGLAKAGYVSIGIDDVDRFYSQRQKLPPKAVLIAFADDYPTGIKLADGIMKSRRLRGVAFIRRTAASGIENQRRFLTRHAVGQMRMGEAWDFGWISQEDPPSVPEMGEVRALLDDDGRRPLPRKAESYPLRFTASAMGLNDGHDDPLSLQVLALRPELVPGENLRIIDNAWPRGTELADDFSAGGFGKDWVPGWGVVSMADRRLAIIPTPRQSSAGVFLRGTEKWRDMVLEFDLKKYQKEFWAYVRYKDDDNYLRVGARDGYWYVEQKTGPKTLPRVLARSPISEGGIPARVRLVLKGDSAIVHVNGRMRFGRVLRIHPSVDQGRILFGVYDSRSRFALAVLTFVRAGPLREVWIAPKDDASDGFDEERLEGLREEAVRARALSPRWVNVSASGDVAVLETQSVLIRSLAGFYGCRLMPMADLAATGGSPLADRASAERLLVGLSEAVEKLDSPGLNVRLRGADAGRPETVAFLGKLRVIFHGLKKELWVTLDDPLADAAPMLRAVDGLLRPSGKKRPGIEILEAGPGRFRDQGGPQLKTPLQMASRISR